MDRAGLVTLAVAVDAPGAVELIRWTLRTDVPDELFREQCARADAATLRFDSEFSFRAWWKEYRRKAAERRIPGDGDVATPRKP